jgi:hypothetical protein
VFILYRNEGNPAIKRCGGAITAQEIEAFGTSRLYIAESSFNSTSINLTDLEPGKLGLLQVDLPREESGVLMMGQLAVKTDWFDRATQSLSDNPKLLPFFRRVSSALKKQLMTPVVGENILTGKTSIYRNIWYSQLAKDFVAKGGRLMQEGVKNVRFLPLV